MSVIIYIYIVENEFFTHEHGAGRVLKLLC